MVSVRSDSPMQKFFDKVAVELGHITIEWGRLERLLDEVIQDLARLDERQVMQAFAGNTDIRSKIQILRALSYIRNPCPEWFSIMIATLDKIDNDIRVRRNAAVHSGWYAPRGRLQRTTNKTKLIKPESFKLILETEQKVPVKLKELRKLKEDLLNIQMIMYFLTWYAMRGDCPSDEELEGFTFTVYLRLAGYGIHIIKRHLGMRSNTKNSRRAIRGKIPSKK